VMGIPALAVAVQSVRNRWMETVAGAQYAGLAVAGALRRGAGRLIFLEDRESVAHLWTLRSA